MKLIICGPLGASVGVLLGYCLPFLFVPGQSDMDILARVYMQLVTAPFGGLAGTFLPTLFCLWRECRGQKPSLIMDSESPRLQ